MDCAVKRMVKPGGAFRFVGKRLKSSRETRNCLVI